MTAGRHRISKVRLKVLVAGGPGTGVTSFVRAASDLPVEYTLLSRAPSTGPGPMSLDIGRVALHADLATIHLFGLPSLCRYPFMWPGLTFGACAAVVLVNPDQVVDAFPVLDTLAPLQLLVALNRFRGLSTLRRWDLREALGVDKAVPVVPCDARDPSSVRLVLSQLVAELLPTANPAAVPPARRALPAAPHTYLNPPYQQAGSPHTAKER